MELLVNFCRENEISGILALLLVLSFNSIFKIVIFYINISVWCERISILSIRLSEYF